MDEHNGRTLKLKQLFDCETETGDPLLEKVRLLSIHRSSLFVLLYLLSISVTKRPFLNKIRLDRPQPILL